MLLSSMTSALQLEAGVYAKGAPEKENATWFEVDAKRGTVEMCMIG